jgi:hypothetical protein
MARSILIIQAEHGADRDIRAICPKSAFRFVSFVHRHSGQDAKLVPFLASFEGDILVDRRVRLGAAAIEAITRRLGRGDPPSRLAFLPCLSIPQPLPDFIGGIFDARAWSAAQKAHEIAQADCRLVDPRPPETTRVPEDRLREAYRVIRRRLNRAFDHGCGFISDDPYDLSAETDALLRAMRHWLGGPASKATPQKRDLNNHLIDASSVPGRRPQGEQPPAARGERREPASEDRRAGRPGGQE